MRCLFQSKNLDHILALSHALSEGGIEHKIETAVNRDWSQDTYGDSSYALWIISEDARSSAQSIVSGLTTNQRKLDEQFEKMREMRSDIRPITATPSQEFTHDAPSGSHKLPRFHSHPVTCSVLLILLAIYALLLWFPQNIITFQTKGAKEYLIVRSPIEKAMLFDYPKALIVWDEGVELLHSNPSLGLKKMERAATTPIWPGILVLVESKKPFQHLPMFERISSGEIWRIWTPSLLHGSFFHYLFNALWILLLLPAVESLFRSRFSLFLFILFVAGISNTAQYLISGFNFLGFSGVVCGLAGYISTVPMAKMIRDVPNGFRVEKRLIRFIQLSIFVLAALSCLLFCIDLFWSISFPFGIANTAHLTGWFTGKVFRRSSTEN